MARNHHHEKFRLEDGFIGYIITLFHNKRMLSSIITTCVILVGILFAMSVKREAMPNIQFDQFRVSISYPGASPVQVEQDAIIPVEDVLKDISGISNYSSTSSQDVGTVNIEVDEDYPDPDEVADEIYRKMTLSSIPDISPDVETLSVERRTTADIAVYLLGLSRTSKEKIDDSTFYRVADGLRTQLKTLPGVSSVNLTGYREEEVEINLDPKALVEEHVDINSVIGAIKNRNVRSTAGLLEDPNNYKVIVSISEYENLEQLRNTVIRSGFDGNNVLLRDLGEIRYAFPKKTVYVRVNLEEAIFLEVKKTPSADIVETAQRVKSFMEEKSVALLPESMTWTEINNEGHNVNEVSRILITNGIIGFILILLILFIFLDFTTAFWTACGLPIIMILTLAYMGATSLTVNYLTLTAMITLIGMLVDHGIVISETIYSRRAKGFPALRACIDGLKSVFWPVVVTVTTTIVAFLPMFLVGGNMGRFTRFFPIMVTVMLTFSFFEACFLMVSHLLHAKAPRQRKKKRRAKGGEAQQDIAVATNSWFNPVIVLYQGSLRSMIRFRWLSMFVFLAILIGGAIFGYPALKNFELFDNSDVPIIEVNYRPIAGASLEQVQEDAKLLEQKIIDVTPESQIKYVFNSTSSGNRGSVRGNIIIYLVDKKYRAMTVGDYNKLLIAELQPFGERSRESLLQKMSRNAGNESKDGSQNGTKKGTKNDSSDSELSNPYLLSEQELAQRPILFENVRIGFVGGGGPGGRAISIRLYSNDGEELSKAGIAAEEMVSSFPGTQNVDSSEDEQLEQIRVAIDYQKMARFGIKLSEVNSTMRAAFNGVTATQSRLGPQTVNYIVRLQEPYRKSLDTILQLTVRAATGEFIPLSSFAELTPELSSSSVQHYNGYRTLRISGDVDTDIEGVTALSVSEEFTKRFPEILDKYPGVSLDLSGGEAQSSREFMTDIVPAFVVAILLILLILILLFDSAWQPLIVLGSIPFGLVGGLVALQLHGIPVGFMAMLGFMGLMGVVVNDSVVMVEFINHIVHRYPDTKSKLLEPMVLKGAGRRLRPVVLTTLTTVLGLFPTVYGLGGDAGFVRPVVLVLGYGLLAATIITLFFIPAVYMMQLDVSYWRSSLKKRIFASKRN